MGSKVTVDDNQNYNISDVIHINNTARIAKQQYV